MPSYISYVEIARQARACNGENAAAHLALRCLQTVNKRQPSATSASTMEPQFCESIASNILNAQHIRKLKRL